MRRRAGASSRGTSASSGACDRWPPLPDPRCRLEARVASTIFLETRGSWRSTMTDSDGRIMVLLTLLCLTWTTLGGGSDHQSGPAITRVLSVSLPDDRLSAPEIQKRVLPRYPDDGAAAGLRGFIDMEV